MLNSYQCEIVAYLSDCEFLCRDCAASETSSLTVEKADVGLANSGGLDPVIRYCLDEHNSQRLYEYASEKVARFKRDHPELAKLLMSAGDAEWQLIDRISDRTGDTYDETCGSCGERLG